jgi:hypothetical protein
MAWLSRTSVATLSFRAIFNCRLVPRLHSTRKDALVTADQRGQDSTGQLSRVSYLSVQIHLTASFVEGSSHRRRGGGSTGLDCSAAGADFLPRASPNVRTCEGARPNDSMFHFEKGSSIESSECAAVPSFCADLSRMLVAKLPVLIRHRSMIRASPI